MYNRYRRQQDVVISPYQQSLWYIRCSNFTNDKQGNSFSNGRKLDLLFEILKIFTQSSGGTIRYLKNSSNPTSTYSQSDTEVYLFLPKFF